MFWKTVWDENFTRFYKIFGKVEENRVIFC